MSPVDRQGGEADAWGSLVDRAAEALAAHRTRLEGWTRKAWRSVHPDVRRGYIAEAEAVLAAYHEALIVARQSGPAPESAEVEAIQKVARAIHEAETEYSWAVGTGPVGAWEMASDDMRMRRYGQARAALDAMRELEVVTDV